MSCFLACVMKDTTSRSWAFLILALGIILSSGSACLLHISEQAQLNNRFAKDVADRAAALDREVTTSFEALYTLRALFIEREMPSFELFSALSQQSRARHPNIEAFYWVANVSEPERKLFENKVRSRLGRQDFQILQHSESRALISAGSRESYRPVLYLESELSELFPLGLDLSVDPEWDRLLDAAGISGKAMLSAGTMKTTESKSETFLQAVLPVYKDMDSFQVIGYVVAVLNLGNTFNDALSKIGISGIDMRLWDKTHPTKPYLLHFHPSRTRLISDTSRSLFQALNPIGMRQWELEAVPTFYYFENKQTWLPHLVFIVGIAATIIIMRLFLSFGAKNERMRIESRDLMTSNQELAEISRTDALTGIANRRYFDEVMVKEWRRAIRNNTSLTLIMVDVDCFKLYNDFYGHLEGDECIRKVAKSLRDMMSRPMDLAARYGGEEFAILLPDTNENAIALAEQCREKVFQQQLPHAASKVSPYVTISLGMATLKPATDLDMSELIRQADMALYKAKESGRNQVCSAHELKESLPVEPIPVKSVSL